MGRKKQPDRMSVNENWLDMPLFTFVGFDCIKKTIGLSEHVHKVFELTYISEGECTWLTGKGQELHLYGGWAAVIQPGEPHQGKWKAISPSRLFWAGFDPFHPDACFNTAFTSGEMGFIGKTLKNAGNIAWKADKNTAEAFEELRCSLELRKAGKEQALSNASSRLSACRLLVAVVNSISNSPSPQGLSETIKNLEAYIMKNLGREISVSELASKTGMSVARFSERFKNESGLSPADFIRRARCESACVFIKAGKLSITEIAFRLGFSSSQHFAGVFKKYTGMTPSQYKKTQ